MGTHQYGDPAIANYTSDDLRRGSFGKRNPLGMIPIRSWHTGRPAERRTRITGSYEWNVWTEAITQGGDHSIQIPLVVLVASMWFGVHSLYPRRVTR